MALSNTLKLTMLLAAKTSAASAAINSFASKTDKKLKSLEKTAKGYSESGSRNLVRGAAIAAPIALATKAAVDLESSVADIAKVLPTTVKVGSPAFMKLEKQAMQVGDALGTASDDAAGLMASLAAGGVAQDDLKRTAILAGKIGVAFEVSGLEAGQSFQAIRNAMNLTEKQTMQVMNANNALANSYGSTIDASARLMKFMKDSGASVASSLHTSGADMEAFANSFMTIGIDSETAGTSIERFSKAILTNSKLAATFNKAGGGTKGIIAILEQAKASGNAVQFLLKHGVGAYSVQLGAVANSMDNDKGLKAQLAFVNNKKNVDGSVNAEFAAKAATKSFQLTAAKNDAIRLAVTLGNTLLPQLGALLKRIKPIIAAVGNWIEKHQELTQKIMMGLTAFAGVSLALGIIQKTIGGTIMGIVHLVKSIKSIVSAVSVVSKFVVANPWILAVVAIATAAYLIYKNWGAISAWFVRLWNNVKKIFNAAWQWIKNMFLNYTAAGLVIKHWNVISKWFTKIWASVKSIFSKTWQWIKGMFLNYTPYGLVIKHWDIISTFFEKLWANIKIVFSGFWDWLSGWAKKFSDIGMQIVNGIWDGIKAKWQWLVDKVTAIWESLKSKFTFGDKNVVSVAHTHSLQHPATAAILRRDANLAQINPTSGTNVMHFSPVIHLSGTATKKDAALISKSVQSQFDKSMKNWQEQQKRKSLTS